MSHAMSPPIRDPEIKSLIQRGIDAAQALGVTYADIRLTHSWERTLLSVNRSVGDTESITIGVRALVNGYWGFASGPVWDAAEVVRLGQEAVRQAKANALGKLRIAELAPIPVVHDGHWTMPVQIDPFSVHPAEMFDLLNGLSIYVDRKGGRNSRWNTHFLRQDKAFGSSDGAYWTQRTYRTSGSFGFEWVNAKNEGGAGGIDTLTPSGAGWELFDVSAMRHSVDRSLEEIKKDMALPVRPVDVGRYDVVLSAQSVSGLLSNTIGAAAELDRALGYEANADGTSYFNDPLTMVGSYTVGAPLLNVTANRTEPGALATVQWDDEGVVSSSFPLVDHGVLVDYQTTREGACWLKDAYTRRGASIESHGCAYAPAGIDAPLARTANLVLVPGQEQHDFDTLIGTMKKGIAFSQLAHHLDFQLLNGFSVGMSCYEVVNGKRVARLADVGILYRAPELWKSLIALGGTNSARRVGFKSLKGEPAQAAYHSVTSVPAMFSKLTIVDAKRKA